MLQALNDSNGSDYHIARNVSKGIRIFTRFSRDFFKPVSEDDRMTMGRLSLPARSEILLAAVHLPSKLHSSNESQSLACTELGRLIAAQEDKIGHRRTVLVGDFNMNPFGAGVVGAAGLHSVMSRNIAARGERTVQGRDYRFFYNPMWNHFGDGSRSTAGSYYYEKSEHVSYFWNIFDQVMLRPELANAFNASKLRIITSVGATSLIRNDGRPDRQYSDHLPIVFDLEF